MAQALWTAPRIRTLDGSGAAARVPWLVVVGAVLLLVAGCGKQEVARTASPRAAAKAFAESMVKGDANALREVSTGDDASLELLTALAASNAAYDRLEQSATKRFGDPKRVISVGRAADHYAKMLPGIDAAAEVVTGDQAAVGVGRNKIYLKRVGEAWKVDRSMHVPPAGSDTTAHLAMTRAMTQAFDEVTNGMASGAYATPEEAAAAYMGKTMQAVLSQQPPATTQAAATTRPGAATRAVE